MSCPAWLGHYFRRGTFWPRGVWQCVRCGDYQAAGTDAAISLEASQAAPDSKTTNRP